MHSLAAVFAEPDASGRMHLVSMWVDPRYRRRGVARALTDVRNWLPADHLAWFVLDVADQLDLHPFLKVYPADGHGRAAYAPRMLLAVLVYGYCTGIRSSRQIERRCQDDIALRVLSANSPPDHVTIARFRVRHEQALAGLLVASLKLCAAANRTPRPPRGPGR